jgi:hypothetical protein
MSNLGVTCLVASALILSPAVFAAQTSQVRIETGAQLVAACQTYLTKSAKESENVVVPVDPCRAYLAGFAAAYGVGQSKNLELRVSGAAPTPPPPREIDVAPWRKPGSGGTKEAPAAPKEEKLPCFVLPSYLSYADFAKLVIAFVSAHAEYRTKPAYIATAAALAEKYPCK